MVCRDCTMRSMGCHSTCKLYLDYQDSVKELNERRQKEHDTISGIFDHQAISKFMYRKAGRK